MQHIPKKSHDAKCPALELLCKTLCGSLTKKFGDPGVDHREFLEISQDRYVKSRNANALSVKNHIYV